MAFLACVIAVSLIMRFRGCVFFRASAYSISQFVYFCPMNLIRGFVLVYLVAMVSLRVLLHEQIPVARSLEDTSIEYLTSDNSSPTGMIETTGVSTVSTVVTPLRQCKWHPLPMERLNPILLPVFWLPRQSLTAACKAERVSFLLFPYHHFF